MAAQFHNYMIKQQFHWELQLQLLPESIWWQHTQHLTPACSLMQACGSSLDLEGY